jgi:thioredoxin-dependent peroxiredoxin
MAQEREAAVTMRGNPLTLLGPELRAGDAAPQAMVVAQDLSAVTVGGAAGQAQVLLSVPSVDTPVCSLETRRFNQEAERLPGVTVRVISVDLPFAQKRWCGAEDVTKVQVLSDHRETDFGEKYGTLIKGLRLLSRAAFVVDGNGKITYAEYVPEVAHEPNYDAILNAARATAR